MRTILCVPYMMSMHQNVAEITEIYVKKTVSNQNVTVKSYVSNEFSNLNKFEFIKSKDD